MCAVPGGRAPEAEPAVPGGRAPEAEPAPEVGFLAALESLA